MEREIAATIAHPESREDSLTELSSLQVFSLFAVQYV